ncbi:glutamate-5-semialdehyde dehydrogenase [Desmospora profundinema]|uniref:Gamma-glutamyl phosphate reductase n=1 Tax=Desmospora profundinema TaxID=1571184 RepID=A0ABU1IPA1_9BACL|nr:glutamate-5-semialdehyde dehydrogenase [Desmospora profundinema]MDR6226603.1 glutamate-5-semialdehyde dehydrogenase [Desmospora profundinema]
MERSDVRTKAMAARSAIRTLAGVEEEEKNAALEAVADALMDGREEILRENGKDLAAGEAAGISRALMDRLTLSEERLAEMAEGLRQLCRLPDPVGEVLELRELDNGLRIEKVRVPLGVIGMIYEARPNVTVDAAGLALKTGNAIVLRGSSSAFHSNRALTGVIRGALAETSLPPEAVQLVEDLDREAVRELMTANGLIDVIIPRGGAGLIQRVVQSSTVPVLETGVGNCHLYVDRAADPDMAREIVINAKTDRPAVCNAAETLLVHREWAESHLSGLCEDLKRYGVEIRGCATTRQRLPEIRLATMEDWDTEFLDLVLAVKVVDSLEEALTHIDKHGTHHSEAIITEDAAAARSFFTGVDAAAVYHNASTRFTDGGQFGFGAEIGISTQKLHARGPMGLKEMTSYQYRIHGNGQVRV